MTLEELYKLMQLANGKKVQDYLQKLFEEKSESLDDMEWLYWNFLEEMFTACAGSTHEPTIDNKPLSEIMKGS